MHQGAGRPFQRRRLRDDATFALEAAYCVEHGLPYSEYLRRWDHRDRAIVAAVRLEDGQRCGTCGTREWEWDEDPGAYVAIQHICPGCVVRDTGVESEDNASKPKGSSTRLIPRAIAERLAATPSRRPLSRRERKKL